MVYNLRAWLKLEFPTLSIPSNGFQAGTSDNAMSINEGAGDDDSYIKRQDQVMQFISRATTKPKARKTAYSVYNYVAKRTGECVLPEAVVDGVTYPAVTAWAFRSVTSPQYIGDDGNGNHMFSFSVDITTTLKNLQ